MGTSNPSNSSTSKHKVATSKNKSPKKKPYINEHILACLMASFKNYDAQAHETQTHDPQNVAQFQEFSTLRRRYEEHLKKFDKRNSLVQDDFKKLLDSAITLYPQDVLIQELYHDIDLISQHCTNMFGQNAGLDYRDITLSAFERWMRYYKNFDVQKRSVITEQRVNAFSYMTQIVKNVIFENVNKALKQQRIQCALYDQLQPELQPELLNESVPSNDFEIIKSLTLAVPKFNDFQSFIKTMMVELSLSKTEIVEILRTYNLVDYFMETINTKRWQF